jgi:2-amino-4-hydroxy-6-hydroxymethyldihydropteridine diphosphokinase
MPLVEAYIALGTNLGDRRANLAAAIDRLRTLQGASFRGLSEVYETEPIGPPGQGAYLNAVAVIDTTLSPRELLEVLIEIERQMGRVRSQRWGPRTIDLDLLLYGDALIDEPGLTVPHPRLSERWFVLKPLHDLAPGLTVPGVGETVAELLTKLEELSDEP